MTPDTPTKDQTTSDTMACDCQTWAETRPKRRALGNGHNTACMKFVPDEGALELLADLVKGIRWWASQEDGVPDEVWDTYSRAVFITEGRFPDPGRD